MRSCSPFALLLLGMSILFTIGSRGAYGAGDHAPRAYATDPVLRKADHQANRESEVIPMISTSVYFESISRREARTTRLFIDCTGSRGEAGIGETLDETATTFYYTMGRCMDSLSFDRLMRLNI